MPGPLSDEKIEEMRAAYLEKASARYVAAKCCVSQTTARKYVYQGTRHVRSFVEDRRRLREKANDLALRRQAQDLDRQRREAERQTLALAAGMKARVGEKLQGMDPQEIAANKIPEHLQVLARVEAQVLGGARPEDEGVQVDVTVQIQQMFGAVAVVAPGVGEGE